MPEMFANATAYERMMGRWSARLAPLFAEFAGVGDDTRILDVGCGTGSLVNEIAATTQRATIVGIDPSETFLAHARARFGDPRITLERGSGMELPYGDASFDLALSSLVMGFVPRPELMAREMRRVTRPGGTVAACTWDRDGLEMAAVLWAEAERIDPETAAKAPRPQHCDHQGEVAALWRDVGLEDVAEAALVIRTEFDSFTDYWASMAAGAGPPGMLIAALSPERRAALQEALRQRLLGGGADRPFSLQAHAWAARGTVPARAL